MREKAVEICSFMLDCISNCYKTKEMYEETFTLKFCLDRYKCQDMCKESVDACLPLLKIVPD